MTEALQALLRQHRCNVDGRKTVGECVDADQCGCSCGLLLRKPEDDPMTASDKIATRLGWNDDGTLDEIVADGAHVHLEQMSGTSYWMGITVDGHRHMIWFHSKMKIKVTHEEEPA